MKRMAVLMAPLVCLTLVCPVAQADPTLTPADHIYTKYLSEYGVNYQGRVSLETMIANGHTTCAMLDENPTPATWQAAIGRLVGGQGNFTQQEAKLTAQAAVSSYCSGHNNLIYG